MHIRGWHSAVVFVTTVSVVRIMHHGRTHQTGRKRRVISGW